MKAKHPVRRCATNPHLPPGNCGCYDCGKALIAAYSPKTLERDKPLTAVA